MQLTSAEKLRPYIQSEPVPVRSAEVKTSGLVCVKEMLLYISQMLVLIFSADFVFRGHFTKLMSS